MLDDPLRTPNTVPEPSTSATVAVLDVKLGAGKLTITAPEGSNAETEIDCELPASSVRLVTLVLIEPSVCVVGGGGGGLVVPPPSSPPPPQPSSADVTTTTQAQRVTCMRPPEMVQTESAV